MCHLDQSPLRKSVLCSAVSLLLLQNRLAALALLSLRSRSRSINLSKQDQDIHYG